MEAQHQRVSLVVNGGEPLSKFNEGIFPHGICKAWKEGEHALAVQVNLPANITLVSISPQVDKSPLKGWRIKPSAVSRHKDGQQNIFIRNLSACACLRISIWFLKPRRSREGGRLGFTLLFCQPGFYSACQSRRRALLLRRIYDKYFVRIA